MKISNYKAIETIKAGSFFKVYKAIQIPFERHVFLKEAKMSLPDNVIERFEREAQIAAFLNHPNIVRIYETFTKKDSIYHAFEWVDGFDLSKIMEVRGKIPQDIALLIIYEVLKALDYAHSKSIVHRDIKPSNIMVSKDGFVKLTDFGVARWEDLPDITQPGIVIGTPHYLSPEQVKGEKPIPSSDIFSLGIVLYEIIFGEKPFKGEDTTSILLKIEKGIFSIPKTKMKGRGKVLKIMKKAIERNKDKRYKSASEMMRDIEKLLGEKRMVRINDILKDFIGVVEKVAVTQTMERKVEYVISNRKKILYALFVPICSIVLLFFSLFLYYRIAFPDLYLKAKDFETPVLKIGDLSFFGKNELKIPCFPSGNYRIVCEDNKRFFLKDIEISKKRSKIILEDTLKDSTIHIEAQGKIFINSENKGTSKYRGNIENVPYFIEVRKDEETLFSLFVKRKSKIYINIQDKKSSSNFFKNLRLFIFHIFNL